MDEIKEIEIGTPLNDLQAMALAINEARKGLGHVSPNPPVGCVIVDKESRLLARGHHEKYGGPHAEINALKGLSQEQLQGARVFVTLEPCAHFGKTPPCAEKLATLPISEVIFGLYDPNPLVQGKGAAIIEKAGIKATPFLNLSHQHHRFNHNHQAHDEKQDRHFQQKQELQEELEEVCEIFLKNMREQKPFVTLKVATSFDGMMALNNGQSQWITGPEARQEGHRLRAHHDALLIGVNTFLSDNPSLNIRHPEFPSKKNHVVVLDPKGRGLPHLLTSKLYSHHEPQNIVWVIEDTEGTSPAEIPKGIQIIRMTRENKDRESSNAKNRNLPLPLILQKLWEHGLKSIFVEGGAYTHSLFVQQNLADRLNLFLAPKLIGGQNGTPWTHFLGPIQSLQEGWALKRPKVRAIGNDLLISSRFMSEKK